MLVIPAKSPLKSEILNYPADKDPLFVGPPRHENPEERAARLLADRQAKVVSDAIDEEIFAERKRAPKAVVKVLLLGQSESGKSTTLKNFQLINSPKAFREERGSWRAVIQFNIARSICIILDAINAAHVRQSPNGHYLDEGENSKDWPTMTSEHLKLKMRLLPLMQVQDVLLRKLTPHGVEYDRNGISEATFTPPREAWVNSSSQWKGKFRRGIPENAAERDSFDSARIDFDDPQDPGVILHNCRDDIIKLWTDPAIQKLLELTNQRFYDTSGFFLDSIERVTALKYVPTDDDILRARLKTLGVSEHRFTLKAGNMLSHDWRIFDVGGSRTLAAWIPYFDHMDAIIFLAPLSAFDQTLEEAPLVNRLEDSMTLYKSIVSNALLKNTDIILFLNKCDILRKKLETGIQFNKWVISYGDRPNTFEDTSAYLRKKFLGIFKSNSLVTRPFYCHYTSVIDMRTTSHILENVKDTVVRKNLADGNMFL
ncbi:guanine nucleotide binding protein, alpha subunit [Cylindrobasidium torrendii FP15055 ss-10]|uniref:Guanine nucleotide binding protein, alpha subunit n=1 Tax=Cylindrobasidium torrendii FP15055 ss-10 TaxID=1314674 RepID=A0A0D7BKM0_9AGAR|nr:guanine nucleotide binding protein, alpha subunit [Cylindrobasidium torrendii FP15055 ss-10]